ncbi:MAG: glycosyltransferase [Syntrophales bacterium]
MKLLIITSSFPADQRIGGIWIPDLIHELNHLGCHVHVLTQNCDRPRTEAKSLWEGCDITCFSWHGGREPLIDIVSKLTFINFLKIAHFFLSGIITGKKICQRWKPDFILAEWIIPGGLMALTISVWTGIPYAVRALGSDVLVATNKSMLRPFIRLAATRAAILFADGFDLCKKTSALAGSKECHFAPTNRQLTDTRSGFAAPEDAGFFRTVTVGRLHVSKGQDVLIKAVKILVDKGIPIRSYIVGYGEEYDHYTEMIKDLKLENNVSLTGKLADGDIKALFKHADCIVIPSRSESISLILGEAAAEKKPVVVTDAGDTSYLVNKYHLGLSVPNEDYVAMAGAIENIITSPNRDQFTSNGELLLSLLGTGTAALTILEKCRAYLHENKGASIDHNLKGGNIHHE